jgi:hypothetical protein
VLNQLGVLFGSLCVLAGAILLYPGFSINDANQIMKLLGGAALFCLGVAVFKPVVKNWLELKRYRRG